MAACAAWNVAPAAAGTGADASLTLLRSTADLYDPIAVAQASPEDNRLLVACKGGEIWILRGGGAWRSTFLNIESKIKRDGEAGLLGFALHPQYEVNGEFFVYFTKYEEGGAALLARGRVSSDPDRAETTLTPVLPFELEGSVHFAGWIGFGPDGYLYVASGDRGTRNNAETLTNNLYGKILRIDIDGDDFPDDPDRNYAIPPDNPFVGIEGDDEIWAFGLRNPWRCAIDSVNGDLYVADVGESRAEEVNFIAAGVGGADLGWPCKEGFIVRRTGEACAQRNMLDPIYAYEHTDEPRRCAVIGGEVYRGCKLGGFDGAYFFSDACSREVWALYHDGSGDTAEVIDLTNELGPTLTSSIGGVISFASDARDELYIATRNDLFSITTTGLPQIESAIPPAGTIDARRPRDETNLPELVLVFDEPAPCVSPLDIGIDVIDARDDNLFVSSLDRVSDREVRITLSEPLFPRWWTDIFRFDTNTGVRLGALPGDVNGDGVSGAPDIIALIDAINGVGPERSIWSTDIDRNGTTGPPDITALIDLLNGANGQQPWLGARIR